MVGNNWKYFDRVIVSRNFDKIKILSFIYTVKFIVIFGLQDYCDKTNKTFDISFQFIYWSILQLWKTNFSVRLNRNNLIILTVQVYCIFYSLQFLKLKFGKDLECFKWTETILMWCQNVFLLAKLIGLIFPVHQHCGKPTRCSQDVFQPQIIGSTIYRQEGFSIWGSGFQLNTPQGTRHCAVEMCKIAIEMRATWSVMWID